CAKRIAFASSFGKSAFSPVNICLTSVSLIPISKADFVCAYEQNSHPFTSVTASIMRFTNSADKRLFLRFLRSCFTVRKPFFKIGGNSLSKYSFLFKTCSNYISLFIHSLFCCCCTELYFH